MRKWLDWFFKSEPEVGLGVLDSTDNGFEKLFSLSTDILGKLLTTLTSPDTNAKMVCELSRGASKFEYFGVDFLLVTANDFEKLVSLLKERLKE